MRILEKYTDQLEKLFHVGDHPKEYVLIYSAGKSGSCTLQHTFTQQGFRTFRVHRKRNLDMNYLRYFVKPEDRSMITMGVIIDFLSERVGHLYVISSFRNHIDRSISAFFQNLSHHMRNNGYTMDHAHDDIILRDTFLKYIANYDKNNEEPLDEEENDVLREIPFDYQNGRTLVSQNNKTYIKLRFCDLPKWGNILSECLQRPITIHNNNMTEHKTIFPLYKQFLERENIIPMNFYEWSVNHPLFYKYNTDDERKDAISKYRKHRTLVL